MEMMYAGFAAGMMAFVTVFTGGFGLPLGVPPEEDPLLAKIAPEKCLAYLSWSGMAKPDGASGNSAEAMLAEPEVQRILAEVDKRLMDALLTAPEGEEDSPQAILAKEGAPVGRLLLTRPAAFFVESLEAGGGGPPDVRGGAVVNLGADAPKVKAAIDKLQKQFLGGAAKAVEVAGTPAVQITLGEGAPEITWAIKGPYLLVGVGPESLAGILARAKNEPPAWLAELRRGSSVKRVSSVVYLDAKALQTSLIPLAGHEADDIQKFLKASGLDGVGAIANISGLDAKGFVSQIRLNLSGDAAGVLTAISNKPLSPLDLEHIPADATLAAALRADARQIFQMMKDVGDNAEPGTGDFMEARLREVEEETGIKIVDGIFAGLGDVWCAYSSPSEGSLLGSGLTVAVTVKDRKKLQPEFDKILKLMQASFDDVFPDRPGPRIKQIKHGEETIHFVGPGHDMPFATAFCLTDTHFIFALFPQNVQAFLSHGKDFQSLARSPHVGPMMKMQGGPSAIVYQDTQTLFKLLYPLAPMIMESAARDMRREGMELDITLLPSLKAIVPHLQPGLTTIARTQGAIVIESRQSIPGGAGGVVAPALIASAAPNIRRMQATARRTQSMNNLKQVGLALHSFHAAHGHFPPTFSVGEGGKPLLSWRVQILPMIEQQSLYEEFKLEEPWDSEHNKKLIAKMPPVFRAATSKSPAGTTVYLTPRGERTIFPGADRDGVVGKIRMAHIRDGTSNTIMVVEAADESAVPWTKPDDFEYDVKAPAKGLIGQHKDGFLACFGDGSVQFLRAKLDAEMLNNLFDRADGNVVDIYGALGRPLTPEEELGRAIRKLDEQYKVPADAQRIDVEAEFPRERVDDLKRLDEFRVEEEKFPLEEPAPR
jgi:hypothetical protein